METRRDGITRCKAGVVKSATALEVLQMACILLIRCKRTCRVSLYRSKHVQNERSQIREVHTQTALRSLLLCSIFLTKQHVFKQQHKKVEAMRSKRGGKRGVYFALQTGSHKSCLHNTWKCLCSPLKHKAVLHNRCGVHCCSHSCLCIHICSSACYRQVPLFFRTCQIRVDCTLAELSVGDLLFSATFIPCDTSSNLQRAQLAGKQPLLLVSLSPTVSPYCTTGTTTAIPCSTRPPRLHSGLNAPEFTPSHFFASTRIAPGTGG